MTNIVPFCFGRAHQSLKYVALLNDPVYQRPSRTLTIQTKKLVVAKFAAFHASPTAWQGLPFLPHRLHFRISHRRRRRTFDRLFR